MTLTRARFNELTAHLVNATMEPVRQAMADAGLKPSDLSKVLLVGGSSRIPAVQEAVKQYTGKEPFKGINPDECVARGAALQAGVLKGEVKGLLLVDVTPLSLGIETVGDVFARIIDRNTALPVKRSQTFSTAANFQTQVEINVLQGEREIASYNKSLGKFRLTGIRRALRGVPQIEVTFSIDANGIVNVSAKDLGTGKAQDITISHTTNMSKEQIEQAVREAEAYAQQDRKQKAVAQLKNHCEEMQYRAEGLVRKAKGQDKEHLKAALERLKGAIQSNEESQMRLAADEMEQILQKMGQTVWQESDEGYEDGACDAQFEKKDDSQPTP